MSRGLNRDLTKEDIQMSNKHTGKLLNFISLPGSVIKKPHKM
jgi:hypothetical protein